MKTAKFKTLRCPKFRHLSMFVILTVISHNIFATDLDKKTLKRVPSSAYEEEVLTVPLEQKTFVKSVFAEDDAGVMKGMRDSLNGWDATEEYMQRWNLESTGLYQLPNTQEKTKFISKNLLRYADKRLAGEIKNAEEGSAFSTMGKVEKSLRPNTTVPVSKYINLKFKARVLQGKAIMDVQNPWVECNATLSANGKAKILTKKDFKQLGTTTGVEYKVNESQWIAFVDQEISQNVKARLSSTTQSNGDDADKRVEMTASFPFNL
ncbi:MAG: hypothetical protein KBD76_07945 [Bacteriovorax sp.]|nr:hypothetical protein [Bacteriovorax sp.]